MALGQRVMGQREWQAPPSAAEMDGAEIELEITGAPEADYRVMLHELDEEGKGEVGLKRRYVDEELFKKNEDGELYWQSQWEAAFDNDPSYKDLPADERKEKSNQNAFSRYLDERTRDDKEKDLEELEKTLDRIIQKIRSANETNMQELSQALKFGQNQRDLSPETGRALARMIDEITNDWTRNRELKEKANRILTTQLDQQVAVRQEIMNGRLRRYSQLNEATKAMVKDWFLTDRRERDMGTIERNAELRVLTQHRKNAPYKVFDGHERDVYPAITRWRVLKRQLDETTDPRERDNIVNGWPDPHGIRRNGMKQMEEIVKLYTSKLTSTFDGRWEPGPRAVTQIEQTSWAEISEINKLKVVTDAGKAKSTLVFGNSSFENWEMNEMKYGIYRDRAVAENALATLLNLVPGGDDNSIINQFATSPDPSDPTKPRFPEVNIKDSRKDELLEELAAAEADYEELKNELKNARDKHADAEVRLRTAEEHRKTAEALHQQYTNPPNPPPPGFRPPNQKQIDDATSALQSAQASEQAAIQREAQARAELNDLESTVNLAKGNIDRLHDIIHNDLTTTEDKQALNQRIEQARIEQGRRLLKNLRKYVGQQVPNERFGDLFKGRDLAAVAKLAGVKSTKHRGSEVLAFDLVEECGDSKYAFINAYNIPDFVGRVPAEILDIIMNDPDRYPGVRELLKKLEKKGKIIICLAQPLTNDLDGGVNDANISGAGYKLDFSKAEDVKKKYGLKDDNELFAAWLDDLQIQAELGARPEEIEERYAVFSAKLHLLREKHFTAADGWTFINSNVSTGTASFFESTIRRMLDAGYGLNGPDFHLSPFFMQKERNSEYAWARTADSSKREVHWGGKNLTENEEAPQDRAERLYRSLENVLKLYYQRSQIGGQTTARAVPQGKDLPDLGTFILANLNLIEKKMMILKALYEYPRFTPQEKIEAMIKWRNGELVHDADGLPWFVRPDGRPDHGMVYLTYDVVDQYTNPNWRAENPELWDELDATIQWQGKENTELRKAEEIYVNTITNPNATDEDKELALRNYNYYLNSMRNYRTTSHLLGMQASGQFDDMSAEEIATYIADLHTEVSMTQFLRISELEMQARFGLTSDVKPGTFQKLLTRTLGAISRSKIAQYLREKSVREGWGLGDIDLNDMTDATLAKVVQTKFDRKLINKAAALLARDIRMPGPGNWNWATPDKHPSILYPRTSAVRQILGLGENDVVGGGLKLTPETERVLRALFGKGGRVHEQILEEISRTIRVHRHTAARSGKRKGMAFKEIVHTFLNAPMNDDQEVIEVRPGVYEYRMYEADATPIGQLDEEVMRGMNTRMGFSIMPGPSPRNTLAAPVNQSTVSHVAQLFNRYI